MKSRRSSVCKICRGCAWRKPHTRRVSPTGLQTGSLSPALSPSPIPSFLFVPSSTGEPVHRLVDSHQPNAWNRCRVPFSAILIFVPSPCSPDCSGAFPQHAMRPKAVSNVCAIVLCERMISHDDGCGMERGRKFAALKEVFSLVFARNHILSI